MTACTAWHCAERTSNTSCVKTLESGLRFGQRTLEALGVSEDEAVAIADDIRKRDEERLQIQAAEGILAGQHMLQ